MFDTLTPNLMGPSAFLLLDLLFISVFGVVDIVEIGSPWCRSKRSRNLITVLCSYDSLIWDIFCLEISDGARREIMGRGRILVGLCHVYERDRRFGRYR